MNIKNYVTRENTKLYNLKINISKIKVAYTVEYFPYFTCLCNMPNVSVTAFFVLYVREEKFEYLVSRPDITSSHVTTRFIFLLPGEFRASFSLEVA